MCHCNRTYIVSIKAAVRTSTAAFVHPKGFAGSATLVRNVCKPAQLGHPTRLPPQNNILMNAMNMASVEVASSCAACFRRAPQPPVCLIPPRLQADQALFALRARIQQTMLMISPKICQSETISDPMDEVIQLEPATADSRRSNKSPQCVLTRTLI